MSISIANWLLRAGLLGTTAAIVILTVVLRMRKHVRPLALWLSAMLLLACLGLTLFAAARKAAISNNALRPNLDSDREVLARMERGGRVIGKYLVSRFPGSKVAIVPSPPDFRDSGEESMLNGILAATDKKLECVIVEMKFDTPKKSPTPWYGADVYDRSFAACDDCRAIVSLAGLPTRLADMRFWRLADQAELIVANTQVIQLQKLIADGKIDALLVRRPWQPGDPVTGAGNEWLLVTTGNIDEIVAAYPTLFAAE